MSSAPQHYVTPEEYLALDRQAEIRSEYIEGEVFAMAKASRNHRRIVQNLTCHLRQKLNGTECNIDGPECRVAIPNRNVHTYPDVLVTCGEERYLGDSEDTLLVPVLLIEVLSPATEDYDGGRKFASYCSLPSFREYLQVAQDRASVEHFYYQEPEVWTFREYLQRGDEIGFQSIPATLSLENIYEKVLV